MKEYLSFHISSFFFLTLPYYSLISPFYISLTNIFLFIFVLLQTKKVLEVYSYSFTSLSYLFFMSVHIQYVVSCNFDFFSYIWNRYKFKNGSLVSPENRKYRCADKRELSLFCNTLDRKLLEQGHLSDVLRR